jgi:hypothetical protein
VQDTNLRGSNHILENRNMTVADRIMFNVTRKSLGLEAMKLFAEAMARVATLDVVWDMTVMSHGQDKGLVNRTVEAVLYRRNNGTPRMGETHSHRVA